jgi:hypothetical protein
LFGIERAARIPIWISTGVGVSGKIVGGSREYGYVGSNGELPLVERVRADLYAPDARRPAATHRPGRPPPTPPDWYSVRRCCHDR